MKKLILLLLFVPLVSFGQTKAGLELCIEYQKAFSSFTSEKEANESLDKILNVIGASKNFVLIPCDDISNALAVTFNGNRFILYDSDFMRKISKLTNNWSNIFVLAHEVGHHINGHTRDFLLATNLDTQSLDDRKKEEIEADEFASFIVSKLGASFEEIEETINLIASNESDQYSTHPSYDKRIAAVKRGFDRSYTINNSTSSSSSNSNKKSVVNSNPNDLVPNFERPRKYHSSVQFGAWERYPGYELEVFTTYTDDPFEQEEDKRIHPIKNVRSTTKGKSLSPNGSKNITLKIETKYFTYDYWTYNDGQKEIKKSYYYKPNTEFKISLEGLEESPKDINPDANLFTDDGQQEAVFATFDYIIDKKFFGTFYTVLPGWSSGSDLIYGQRYNEYYESEGKYYTIHKSQKEDFLSKYPNAKNKTLELEREQLVELGIALGRARPNIIEMNGVFSKSLALQKQNYEFIEKLKAGKKLYLRFGKLFYYRNYYDMDKQDEKEMRELYGEDFWFFAGIYYNNDSNEYDIPRNTYEFDLTGSSKALEFID